MTNNVVTDLGSFIPCQWTPFFVSAVDYFAVEITLVWARTDLLDGNRLGISHKVYEPSKEHMACVQSWVKLTVWSVGDIPMDYLNF